LEVDASQFATGAILAQRDERGRLRPVGNLSHSFTPAERNYDVHDRELLAVVRGLRGWRHILLSTPFKITVYTDHANLQYYRHPQRINRRVARYLGDMADYDFVLVHKPGKNNHADHLSRRPDFDEGAEDNTDITVLPEKLFVRATEIINLEMEIVNAQEEEKKLMEALKKGYVLDQARNRWYYHARLVVPEKEELLRQILKLYHDHEAAGHPGIANTLKAVAREFWWPTMKAFVVAYVKGCATCQSTKPNTTRPRPPIMPIGTEQNAVPFHTISWDLITDLPVSEGYNAILTIVDHGCSKAAIFLPCAKTIDALGVARLYAERVFPFYGVPQRVISDRDPRFTATIMKELCEMLGISQNISTAFHPQTDGQSERANQRVEQYLRIYGNTEQNDWAQLLPLAQFVHNTWTNETTGRTPYELLIGHTPTIHATDHQTKIPALDERKGWLERTRAYATAAIKNAQRLLVKRSERRKGQRHFKEHNVDDLVWLEGSNLRLSHPIAKLAPK
jgi:RNase H-like domain found in reverse transcriptase/Integrase zinc binding domain